MATSLRQLFDDAAGVPEPLLDAWLLQHCADPALRAAVRALLAADREASTTGLLRPIADIADVDPPADSSSAGTAIGPFILDECIGQGGSSSVHRAHRDLDGVRQTVALKVLRRGIAAPESRRQFDRERQALAQLQHPHIAQFIDGGVTDEGSAWLALEFVDGLPITTYVRQRTVNFRQRITLMIAVARAVAAAHRRLIVHRDIKPGNVLVSTDGHVKLLDFGIAKLLGDEADAGGTQTQAFTPAYAAPEQRDGRPITTATDVYALGVLLGELVTGRRLTEGGSSAPSSQISAEIAPGVLPAEPAQTRRLVKGDLDNILLKAVDEEPERRYATAEALADDLERLLDGQPVLAHPPSGWYRLSKLIKRNRVATIAIVFLALGLAGSTAFGLRQAHAARAEAERARSAAVTAEQAQRRAESTRDFLVQMFESAMEDLPQGQRPTPDKLVAAAIRNVAQDPTLDAPSRAEVLLSLMDVAHASGDFVQVSELADRARATLADLSGAEVEALRFRADMMTALALERRGRIDEAEQLLEAMAPRMAQGDIRTRIHLEGVWMMVHLAKGRPESILEASQRAIALAAEHYGVDHPRHMTMLMLHGNALSQLQRFQESVDVLRPVVEKWRLSGGPMNVTYLRSLNSLAVSSRGIGDYAGFEESIRAVYEARLQTHKPPHETLARAMRNYGAALGIAGKLDEAIDLQKRARQMTIELDGADGLQAMISAQSLGSSLFRRGRIDEARAMFNEGVRSCKATGHRDLACARHHQSLALILEQEGRPRDAMIELAAAERALAEIDATRNPGFVAVRTAQARVLCDTDPTQALISADEAITLLSDLKMTKSVDMAAARGSRACALLGLGRYAEALTEVRQALERFAALEPGITARRAQLHWVEARILLAMGRTTEARATATQGLALDAEEQPLPESLRESLKALGPG